MSAAGAWAAHIAARATCQSPASGDPLQHVIPTPTSPRPVPVTSGQHTRLTRCTRNGRRPGAGHGLAGDRSMIGHGVQPAFHAPATTGLSGCGWIWGAGLGHQGRHHQDHDFTTLNFPSRHSSPRHHNTRHACLSRVHPVIYRSTTLAGAPEGTPGSASTHYLLLCLGVCRASLACGQRTYVSRCAPRPAPRARTRRLGLAPQWFW